MDTQRLDGAHRGSDATNGRRWRLFVGTIAVVVVGALVALGFVLFGPKRISGSGSGTGGSAAAGQPGDTCSVPPGATPQDIDESDDPEEAWPHTPGQEITVYFQIGGVQARYANMVKQGVELWSKSPCINAVAVDTCPADSNCTKVSTELKSNDDRPGDVTDGESSGRDRGGVRSGDKIIYYTGALDQESDNGALATVVHEMGHALGLVHRLDKNDLMNAKTDDNTSPQPDAIDYHNLAVIYAGSGEGNQDDDN